MLEHTDPDQIDAHFSPDVLAGDGSMVGYYEILPYAKPVEFTLGAQTWLLDDQHCVRAKCSCQEAALSFFELRPSAQPSGIGSEPTLCIRYAYDTGQIEPLSGAKGGRWSGQDFVDALREVLPDLDSLYKCSHRGSQKRSGKIQERSKKGGISDKNGAFA
jgi:hypothetical protein